MGQLSHLYMTTLSSFSKYREITTPNTKYNLYLHNTILVIKLASTDEVGSIEYSIYNLLTLYMFISIKICYVLTFCTTWALVVKNVPSNAGDTKDSASIPRLGRFP